MPKLYYILILMFWYDNNAPFVNLISRLNLLQSIKATIFFSLSLASTVRKQRASKRRRFFPFGPAVPPKLLPRDIGSLFCFGCWIIVLRSLASCNWISMGDLQACSLPNINGDIFAEDRLCPLSPLNPDPASIGEETWIRAETTTQEIISWIQPTLVANQKRRDVIDYVQRLLKYCIGCEVIGYINIIIFFSIINYFLVFGYATSMNNAFMGLKRQFNYPLWIQWCSYNLSHLYP